MLALHFADTCHDIIYNVRRLTLACLGLLKAFFDKKSGINFLLPLKISIFAAQFAIRQQINKNNNIKTQIKKMTKADIVNKIVEDTGLAKKDVLATVEAFMEEVRQSLSVRKEDVFLRGFGSFIVKRRAKKTARNISKNTTIIIDAHDYPGFKPAKSFIAKMLQ